MSEGRKKVGSDGVIPAQLVPGPLGERESSFLFLDPGPRPAAPVSRYGVGSPGLTCA